MSERTAMTVWRRIARDQRVLVLPLLILIAVNVLVHAAFIYPLSRRVSSVTERTQAAESELTTARLAHVRASSALQGRSDASREIDTFYAAVLPADYTAARNLIVPRLQNVARATRVRAESVDVDLLEPRRDEMLTQLRIRMDLTGTYPAIREFIHRIEHAEEFVIVDGLDLSEIASDSATLTVRIALSTYFQRATP